MDGGMKEGTAQVCEASETSSWWTEKDRGQDSSLQQRRSAGDGDVEVGRGQGSFCRSSDTLLHLRRRRRKRRRTLDISWVQMSRGTMSNLRPPALLSEGTLGDDPVLVPGPQTQVSLSWTPQ